MNSSLRDLGQRAAAVPAPQLDVAALVAAGETRIRRRRLVAVAGVTAAVVAVVGGTLLASPGSRETAPPPAGPDRTQAPDDSDMVTTGPQHRLLTFAVGTTIHWGDRTIDVSRQARGRNVRRLSIDYLDATDDGVVFITGPRAHRYPDGEIGIAVGDSTVWFTDGSTPVRIGSTVGNAVRGFPIASSVAGSILAWSEGGDNTAGQVVVYDTAERAVIGRFGEHAVPLAVYDDVVYWSPRRSPCLPAGWGRSPECTRDAAVMRFDVASGLQSRVPAPDYLADRRARPGLFLDGWPAGRSRGSGVMFVGLVRRGDRLVVPGSEPGVDDKVTVAGTGRPLRLRLPARDRNPDDLAITQWLDADRVVLVDTDSADGTDFLVCRLSTGRCRLAARLPDANYTEPGPTGIHG